MSGLKHITGLDAGHAKAVKVRAPKAPKMPAEIKATIPKVPKIKPSHGIAGGTHASHGSQVAKAMRQPQLRAVKPRLPGIPVGNPGPYAQPPKGPGVPTPFQT